jgi:antitoxin component YwqK of YwqJK toxin-antitoxin module
VNQQKDSTWNYFSENDTITAIENYKAGKPHGIWKTFYPSGSLLEEYSFVNGIKTGPVKKYFTNGTIKYSGFYKNDTFDSTAVFFHLSGKPMVKGQYVNGLKEGEWIYMNESGVRDSSETYSGGQLIPR